MKKRIVHLLLFAVISGTGAMGQINCADNSPASQKLVCQFPFATGVFTNDTALGGTTAGISNAVKAAGVFNNAIATQVSQLPLASASAGTVVLYKDGVPETFDNLGPILTDRAQTVGRKKLFLGFTASQFVFTDIDGISLSKLPFAYYATAYFPGTDTVQSNTYTSEYTKLKFKINQFIGVATYGVSGRMDLSIIVPIERISIGATTYNSESFILSADNVLLYGPYAKSDSFTPGTASGVGDITVNAKQEIWRGEHATFSAALNLRAPTGDDLNYLGSGAWGINPYAVYSYLWKVSPHAKIGYQWNTATELNNPTATSGGNQNLPGGVQYDVGADWAAMKHVTLAADLLGSQYLNAPHLLQTSTPLPTSPSTVNLATISTQTSSYSINTVSAGAKWNPYRNLVVSVNVLFQLNNNGLRSRPAPLVGLSYKF